MRIGVTGLGYVGAVTAACLARDGHDVFPHLGAVLLESLEELCLHADVLVIGQKPAALAAALARRTVPARIVDLVGFEAIDPRDEYVGICS